MRATAAKDYRLSKAGSREHMSTLFSHKSILPAKGRNGSQKLLGLMTNSNKNAPGRTAVIPGLSLDAAGNDSGNWGPNANTDQSKPDSDIKPYAAEDGFVPPDAEQEARLLRR